MVKVGMQRAAHRFGDALQEHRAHLGVETLLVFACEYQQAYSLAAGMQWQVSISCLLYTSDAADE